VLALSGLLKMAWCASARSNSLSLNNLLDSLADLVSSPVRREVFLLNWDRSLRALLHQFAQRNRWQLRWEVHKLVAGELHLQLVA
jgi:hypothetical protein